MAQDLTRDSERLLNEGRALVRDNQAGGRHRAEGIAQGSRRLRRRHFGKKLKNIALSVVGIIVAASIAGIAIDGLGFVGVMVTFFAIMAAIGFFSSRKIKIPDRSVLTRTQDARQLVARTELWLENQRPALPPPAVRLVEDIGVQLDGLGDQLEHVDPAHPAAQETRKLVGEVLPEMVDSYRKIPGHLRQEERAGSTPDKQLVESLGKISKEIDHVTRQLAEGSLDDLAIRTRYLDYKYGDAEALPSPEKTSPEST